MSADKKDKDTNEQGAQPARFDEALKELEAVVESLEQGDLSLDESLARFERGIGLARECRDSLKAAEQRVQVLLEDDNGDESLAPFRAESDTDTDEPGNE